MRASYPSPRRIISIITNPVGIIHRDKTAATVACTRRAAVYNIPFLAQKTTSRPATLLDQIRRALRDTSTESSSAQAPRLTK